MQNFRLPYLFRIKRALFDELLLGGCAMPAGARSYRAHIFPEWEVENQETALRNIELTDNPSLIPVKRNKGFVP